MLPLLAIIVDFIRLKELIRLSSILRYVWSPDAPTHVALRPYLGPIFGTRPGYAYHGPSRDTCVSLLLLVTGDSCDTAAGDGRPSWPFCNIDVQNIQAENQLVMKLSGLFNKVPFYSRIKGKPCTLTSLTLHSTRRQLHPPTTARLSNTSHQAHSQWLHSPSSYTGCGI